MMNSYKQLEKYKSVDIHSRVEAATPHELIELLLQGAQTNITKATGFLQQNNITGKTECINKTIEIIGGLIEGLDYEKGGEVAHNLHLFYQTILKLLVDAHTKNDISLLLKINEFVGEIVAAWKAIKPQTEMTK
jgi:flagellar secretion chaperone FliS